MPKKGHFTWGSKTCFAHISFKSTLYKNRSFYKPWVYGGTATGLWVFLDTIEHVYFDFWTILGPLLTAFFGVHFRDLCGSFWALLGPFWGHLV